MLARDPSIRSPTWSLLTYGWRRCSGAGFWLLALINALVAAADARAGAGAPVRRSTPAAVWWCSPGWRSLTPLPWFASYLMPDLYAGLLVLAAALLVLRLGAA